MCWNGLAAAFGEAVAASSSGGRGIRRGPARRTSASAILRALSIAVVVLSSSGCTAVEWLTKPAPEETRFRSANVVEERASVKIPADTAELFRKELHEHLYKPDRFREGAGLTIKWRFLEFKKGNEYLRWAIGGGPGAGHVKLEVKFYNRQGEELTTIQPKCKVESGFLGGSIDDVMYKCASEIATFAATNYHGR